MAAVANWRKRDSNNGAHYAKHTCNIVKMVLLGAACVCSSRSVRRYKAKCQALRPSPPLAILDARQAARLASSGTISHTTAPNARVKTATSVCFLLDSRCSRPCPSCAGRAGWCSATPFRTWLRASRAAAGRPQGPHSRDCCVVLTCCYELLLQGRRNNINVRFLLAYQPRTVALLQMQYPAARGGAVGCNVLFWHFCGNDPAPS